MDRFFRDRRRAQAGTTLIELLVSLTIIAIALVLVIGVFSTGLLDASLTKRNTAVEAVTQYELDKVHASPFDPSAKPYSECFATEKTNAPLSVSAYGGSCGDSSYTLRADVTCTLSCATNVQTWQVVVVTWPSADHVGNPVSLLKVNR
jgi:type II secretory pathway pseudopilin PulG